MVNILLPSFSATESFSSEWWWMTSYCSPVCDIFTFCDLPSPSHLDTSLNKCECFILAFKNKYFVSIFNFVIFFPPQDFKANDIALNYYLSVLLINEVTF